MTDNGWGFGWILAGLGLGVYAGNKLIPWSRRHLETENLEDLAERVLALAEEEPHQVEALEILHKIKKYREGLLEKKTSDEEHKGVIAKTKKAIRFVARKINPFSSNGKEKLREVESDLASDAA